MIEIPCDRNARAVLIHAIAHTKAQVGIAGRYFGGWSVLRPRTSNSEQDHSRQQDHFSHCRLLGSFPRLCPVNSPYAARRRGSSDKERQGGTEERCRTMSREIVSWRVESKGFAEENGALASSEGRRIGNPGEMPGS